MTLTNITENIVYVTLMADGRVLENQKKINELAAQNPNIDVILDFSGVQLITSLHISNLLILFQFLAASGRKLVLCNLSLIVKCILRVTGLSDVLVYAENKEEALQILHCDTSAAHVSWS